VINLDEGADDGRVIAVQSLSNSQLIQILQHHDGDDDVTQMVEEELKATDSNAWSSVLWFSSPEKATLGNA
jgi:hypothetical protein